MRSETAGSGIHIPQLRVFEDPYLKVRIDAVDHENVYAEGLVNWTRSATAGTTIYDNRAWVGLWPNHVATTLDLTKTVNFPHTGLYRVEIGYRGHPSHIGGFSFYDGSDLVEDYQDGHSTYDYVAYRSYKPRRYTSGNHNLKVKVYRNMVVSDIIITPLTRYTGDNQGNTSRNDRRLDLSSVEFTQNSVAESNTCTVKLPMRDEYLRSDDWYTPYVFDYNDSMTVWLGESPADTSAVFGGYLARLAYSSGSLDLTARDRLLDLDRTPLYQNFSIGGAVAPEGSTRPFTAMPSVYELARMLSETCRYPLRAYGVPFDFAVNLDYSSISDFNNTPVNVWSKYYDLRNGYPAPSLKLGVGDSTGTASAILYQSDDPFDAHEYGTLSLDYYASGAGSRYPLPWNLVINMHKSGETSADGLDYTVQVSNGAGTRTLTSYTPKLNGEWQRLTLDLESLFTKTAASSEYNVNNIRLEGTVTETQTQQRRCSTLWIGGLYCYKTINHAPKYASQDVKTPLEELQQLCERTSHAAYCSFGDTREDDVLVVSPCEYTTASVAVDEGSNLIELESTDYDPLGDEYTNYYHMTFNFDENNAGSSEDKDWSMMAHYREYQRHDFNSDLTTQADANSYVTNYLTERKYPKLGFTVNIHGTTELMPEQYAVVSIPSHRLVGSYPVKSLTHTWSKTGGYTTRVDFGKASNRFRQLIRQQQRSLKNLGVRDSSKTYRVGGTTILGGSAPGAFIT